MDSNPGVELKKKRLKSWLLTPEHLWLLAIIAGALIIRIYYFFVTHGQTMWWDEAEYMATAKHWAYGVPYDLNYQRPPLFQLTAAALLAIGVPESWLIFLLVLLPSALLVLVTYWLGKEMFDSKIGVIAAGGMAFMWSFLFWSVRFQPDFWSLNFQLLAILFYWKVFKHGRTKYAALAGVCAAAAFYFKISALLVPFSIFIFIFLKERFSFIKNKNHWVALGSYLLALVPFMVWQFITFGNPLAFAPSYALPEYRAGRSLGWMALQFFYSFSGIGFFVLFIIGVGIFLFYLAMTSDLYLKGKYKEASPELLSFIVLLVNAAFYIFFIKGIIEDRWIFLIAPFVFFFSAKGMMVLYNYLYKIRKGLALFFVLAMFAFFIYGQIAHSYPLLINKKSTYLPVKESSLWIKDHTSPGDSFLSISYTQATSYSERKVITYSTFNASVLDEVIAKDKPKYLMVSVFEPHPSWISPWIESNSARLTIAQAYFADPSQKQPLLIVYEIKK